MTTLAASDARVATLTTGVAEAESKNSNARTMNVKHRGEGQQAPGRLRVAERAYNRALQRGAAKSDDGTTMYGM